MQTLAAESAGRLAVLRQSEFPKRVIQARGEGEPVMHKAGTLFHSWLNPDLWQISIGRYVVGSTLTFA